MTTRTVFKICGSFGPGGSIVTFAEKFCKVFFPEAYDLGDPTEFHTEEEDKIRQCRQDFVNDLFNFKGVFERMSGSLKLENRERAYRDLGAILKRYQGKMVRLEKGKLTRERIFYGNEGNHARY